jgi:hypothetical protein
MCIYIILLYGLCGCLAAQQCAALCSRSVVCGSASGSASGSEHGGVRAVRAKDCAQKTATERLVVYGNVRGGVRLSGSAVVCGSVQQCSSVRQYERQSVAVRIVVCVQCPRQCVALRSAVVYGRARGSVWLCGSVRQRVWQCALPLYLYTKLLTL